MTEAATTDHVNAESQSLHIKFGTPESMMTDPEIQSYRNGKDDMKERIIEVLQQELDALTGMHPTLIDLTKHLIKRIEKVQ